MGSHPHVRGRVMAVDHRASVRSRAWEDGGSPPMPTPLARSHRRLTGSILAAFAGLLLVELTTGSISPAPHLVLRAVGVAAFAGFALTVRWVRAALPPQQEAHP